MRSASTESYWEVESPSRYCLQASPGSEEGSPVKPRLRLASRAPTVETQSSRSSRSTREGQLMEDHDRLVAKLREKDNQWRRALLEVQCLKEENGQLHENLKYRPTNEQHDAACKRATMLEHNLEVLESNLTDKQLENRRLAKKTQKLTRVEKCLSENTEQLTKTLTMATEDFKTQLNRANGRNKKLQTVILEKNQKVEQLNRERLELELRLVSEKRRNEAEEELRRRQGEAEELDEGCQTPRTSAVGCLRGAKPGPVEEAVVHLDASGQLLAQPLPPSSDTPNSSRRSSLLFQFMQTPVSVLPSGAPTPGPTPGTRPGLPLGSTRSEPSFCESVCQGGNSPANAPTDLAGFLQTLTRLSTRLAQPNSTTSTDGVLSTFQDEIQRCIECWSSGEVPHEEIFALMERAFEEWAEERTKRQDLEEQMEKIKSEHKGLVRRVCMDLYDISMKPKGRNMILWIPVKIAGWFVWVPIKLSLGAISTYVYLLKRCLNAAGICLTKAGMLMTGVGGTRPPLKKLPPV